MSNIIVASSIAHFDTIREQMLDLVNHLDEIDIVEFNSNIAQNKEMRDAYPIYQLILSIGFYKKNSSPENIQVVNPFEDDLFMLEQYHPKALFAILKMIKTDKVLSGDNRDKPSAVYLASQSSFNNELYHGHTKYTIGLVVTFCDGEHFDAIPRAPISAYAIQEEIKNMFGSNNESPEQST